MKQKFQTCLPKPEAELLVSSPSNPLLFPKQKNLLWFGFTLCESGWIPAWEFFTCAGCRGKNLASSGNHWATGINIPVATLLCYFIMWNNTFSLLFKAMWLEFCHICKSTWLFIGRTDAKVEAPILWLPDAKSWFTGKDVWCQERLRAGGGYWEWDGWMSSPMQWTWVWANSRRWWRTGGYLACCSPWGHRVTYDLRT